MRSADAARTESAVTAEPPREQTSAGLPVRVRQANLADALRDAMPADPAPTMAPARPPEQIRRMMSSYQKGTLRGRTAAAELLLAEGNDGMSGTGPDGDGTRPDVDAGDDTAWRGGVTIRHS